jgi:hypothetical protein
LVFVRLLSQGQYAVAEWLVSVTLDKPEEITMDLFNESAILIYNKDD